MKRPVTSSGLTGPLGVSTLLVRLNDVLSSVLLEAAMTSISTSAPIGAPSRRPWAAGGLAGRIPRIPRSSCESFMSSGRPWSSAQSSRCRRLSKGPTVLQVCRTCAATPSASVPVVGVDPGLPEQNTRLPSESQGIRRLVWERPSGNDHFSFHLLPLMKYAVLAEQSLLSSICFP